MIPEMTAQLRAGDPFSEAIAAHSENFPSYYPGIIGSAELSGRLDMVLDQLADYIDRDLQTRRRVKSALTYPAILGVMSLVTVGILIGFVLPKFKEFFESFHAKLPFTTRFMLGLGDFAQKSGWMVVLGLLALVAVVIVVRQDRTRAPVPGQARAAHPGAARGSCSCAIIERFCRILSTMVQAGIPISAGMTAAID